MQTVISQWKRVQAECNGQKKSVMKVVNSDMTKEEFVAHVTKQSNEFEEHVSRIKTQYSEMKTLKMNLPENHCIVHMDFSENYCHLKQTLFSVCSLYFVCTKFYMFEYVHSFRKRYLLTIKESLYSDLN